MKGMLSENKMMQEHKQIIKKVNKSTKKTAQNCLEIIQDCVTRNPKVVQGYKNMKFFGFSYIEVSPFFCSKNLLHKVTKCYRSMMFLDLVFGLLT